MEFDHFVFLTSLIFISDVSNGYLDGVEQHRRRLIIDTDAGADDAVAILNILGNENSFGNIKVELITTVAGNTHVDNVARNVLKILKIVDRLDIPIYRGANESILYSPDYGDYFGKDGFGDFDFENPPSEDLIKKTHAANALTEFAAANAGQITLICLGPLTNVALAIRLDPKFVTNLKDIFVLGGSDSGEGNIKPGIEFNFYVDPEAAFITFREAERNKKILNLLTWETAASRSPMDMEWRKTVLGTIESPQIKLINNAEHLTLEGDKWLCADGALSAVMIDNAVVEHADSYHLEVELCGRHSRGAVFIDYGGFQNLSANVQIIKRLNVDKLKKMLLQNLSFHKGLTSGALRTF